MKMLLKAAGAAGLLGLAACGGGADDKAASNIEAATENRADALDAQADKATNGQVEDALEDKAEQVRETGDEKAEQADDKDDARIENQVLNRAP
jgi:type II secretory pathway component PulJ